MQPDEIKKLLAEKLGRGELRAVIGYRGGTNPFFRRPLITSTPREVEELDFSPLGVENLCNYITDMVRRRRNRRRDPQEQYKPTAVLVRGCHSRALNVLLQEKLIPREELFVVGLPCRGVVDPRKAQSLWHARAGNKDHRNVVIDERGLFELRSGETVQLASFEEIADQRHSHCRTPNPLFYDVMAGEPLAEEPVEAEGQFSDVEDFLRKTPQERWSFWSEQFSRCIRCYACKNICPACSCQECSLAKDTEQPVDADAKVRKTFWLSKQTDMADNASYHINRALHLAGRCVSCGECERACPMGIPLLLLYRSLAKHVFDDYRYEAGMDAEVKPIMTRFSTEDREDFMEE
jgi:formate dehydrogenase subunit beta